MGKIVINFETEICDENYIYDEEYNEKNKVFTINNMYAEKYLKLINAVYDDDFDDTCFCAEIYMNEGCFNIGILEVYYAKGKFYTGEFLIQLIGEIGDMKIFDIENICM